MSERSQDLVALARADEPLGALIGRMGRGDSERIFEVALVVGDGLVLEGIINTGDILRALADGVSLEQPAEDVMVRHPVTAPAGASKEEILQTVRSHFLRRTSGKKDITRFVPLVDPDRTVRDVVDVFALLAHSPRQGSRVEVFGLGFVGLTVAVSLASRGHSVAGIDNDEGLIAQLHAGEPHVFEPRLPDMMRRAMEEKHLTFSTTPSQGHHRVVLIAVGTPVKDDHTVALEALRNVCEVVGSRLRRGDLVMLRSTVPVGTTRGLVRDILKTRSGLEAGEQFHLAFTPERTVAGRAMQELTSLPQIVGGLTPRCAEMATLFWQTVTDSVIQVESLEAAELVKLANNTYRDLSFAFANGLAMLSDRFNLDANRLVAAANEGYPRNPIPRPSPGVGGTCLSKDPLLYASVEREMGHGILAHQSRTINKEAGLYAVEVVQRFARRIGQPLSALSVLLVGIAFKGSPPTNDTRNSTALDVGSALLMRGCEVLAFDAVVDDQEIAAHGFTPVSLDAASQCDALLIMNNHVDNVPNGLIARLEGRRTLLFDGWSQFDRYEVEQCASVVYATMGYMTPEKTDAL